MSRFNCLSPSIFGTDLNDSLRHFLKRLSNLIDPLKLRLKMSSELAVLISLILIVFAPLKFLLPETLELGIMISGANC